MSGSVEEEEIRCLDCHDKHNPASNHEKEQDDNVEGSKDVQRDVAGTHLGFGKHIELCIRSLQRQELAGFKCVSRFGDSRFCGWLE